MSEDFADHCILNMNNTTTLSHVAHQSLRDKLLLLPHNTSDLTLRDPSSCTNTNNPPLFLDLPSHDAPNPNDWLINYNHRYQDLSNLYTPPIAVDMQTHLLHHHPYPHPLITNPDEMGQAATCDVATQGLTLSLAASAETLGFVQDLLPLTVCKNVGGLGHLGPFTGYATILRSSTFLKPAQQLMDECCIAATDVAERKPSNVVGSSNVVLSRCDLELDGGGCSRAEIQERKAKLLVLQGEVCKRYKQYNQQIQMAISSFESVAGLSGAIPFMAAAVKTVFRHFRVLRNVISEQVVQISRALGEEVTSSPALGSEKAATSNSKFLDQTFRRQKFEENSHVGVTNNQPIWRPQRGLPERAVAVLRAWLFEHFLHPYPTDTDKIMLAHQTGLSRNQVSNWFINARVRVWKPMVEEIHMLETEGIIENDSGTSKSESSSQRASDNREPIVQQSQQSAKFSHLSHIEQISIMDQRPVEKRSRMDPCSSGVNVGCELVDLSAYHGGFEVGGLGSVSLTLALRQDDGLWQQSFPQMHPCFGNQMING